MPVSAVAALVASAVLVALSWVVALLAGLFVTDAFGSFLTWTWFGVVAVVLVVWWTCLYRRSLVSVSHWSKSARRG